MPCVNDVKSSWLSTHDVNVVSVSYEERLSSLVLKEEFFPLMGEMKEYIFTLTAAGNGTICFPRF